MLLKWFTMNSICFKMTFYSVLSMEVVFADPEVDFCVFEFRYFRELKVILEIG
jgi:hypothetical protein